MLHLTKTDFSVFVFDETVEKENGFVCSKKERSSLEGLTVIEKVRSLFVSIAYFFLQISIAISLIFKTILFLFKKLWDLVSIVFLRAVLLINVNGLFSKEYL